MASANIKKLAPQQLEVKLLAGLIGLLLIFVLLLPFFQPKPFSLTDLSEAETRTLEEISSEVAVLREGETDLSAIEKFYQSELGAAESNKIKRLISQQLAHLYQYEMNDNTKAIAVLEVSLQEHGQLDYNHAYQMANLYMIEGNYEKAEEFFNKALVLINDNNSEGFLETEKQANIDYIQDSLYRIELAKSQGSES